ncbi:MAG: hypothetical protein II299_01425 [Alistipes sp.]|nr:hypothetical protein [Alistipes sp.]
MKYSSIVTPAEVIALAFSDGGYVAAENIGEVDIATAVRRWVKPVVGEALLGAVTLSRYKELRDEYLKPTVALYTRLLVQPRLNAVTSQLGLTVAAGASSKVAEASLREEHLRAIKTRAHAALRALSDYLNDHVEEISEYNPKENVLNRCSCDGGFVQIF